MKMYLVPDTALTSVADAIRDRTKDNKKLVFPDDFITEINQITEDFEVWDGDYNVTPSVDAQTLDTKGKMMENNVTIKKIPYYEVSNNFGYTVYIGGELDG